MRSIQLALVLASSLAFGGCTAINNFGDFSFGGDTGEEDGGPGGKEDGGPVEEMDASKGDPDSGMMSTDKDSGPTEDKDAGGMGDGLDAGMDAGEQDSGPVVDPLCEAANCDTNATCTIIEVGGVDTADCSCDDGYFGDGTMAGTGCIDLNECLAPQSPCPAEADCANVDGGFECVEKTGYDCQQKTNGDYECFPECLILLSTVCNPATSSCSYPNGSGECHCKGGYKDVSDMQDGTDCVEDEVCAALVGVCHAQAVCDATDIANPVCVCLPGYDGDGEDCVDIDECMTAVDTCDDATENCGNTAGGFTCSCKGGYEDPELDGTCEDIDECDAGTDDCSDDANCNNTTGSFMCECKNGFTGDGKTCTDLNECMLGTDNCSDNANCNNTAGSFSCACKDGYTGNGVTCNDIDECAVNNGGCGVGVPCANSPGSFSCGCAQGQRKNGSNVCVDINECAEDLDNCSVNANCTNVSGAPYFTCACKNGYTGNGVTCTDIDECDLNTDNCSNDANCTNIGGSFTCMCKNGFTGNGVSCTDVNECDLNSDNCHDTRATCTNTSGSFTCMCNNGYSGNGITCTDLDECSLGMDNCDNSPDACMNTTGSFTCMCPMYYTGTGIGDLGCTDLEECKVNNGGCDTSPMATCNEVVAGSPTCSCPAGTYTTDNGVTCLDIPCSMNNGGCDTSPMATCANVNNAPNTCTCPAGTYTTDGGVTCLDIPCNMNNGGCDTSPMATCANVNNAPNTCTCPAGTYTTDGGVTCLDVPCNMNNGGCDTSPMATCVNVNNAPNTCTCPAGTYTTDGGVTCLDIPCGMNNGGCDTLPMATCVNVDNALNSCTCPAGYMGDGQGAGGCVNINECSNGSHRCSTGGTCTDSEGSYSCACNSGYTGNGYVCLNNTTLFPEHTGASSPKDLNIPVAPTSNGAPTLQCRSYKRSGATPAFGACATPIKYSTSIVNYATWDPAWNATGITFSNGNRSISGNSAGTKNVRATVGKDHGKWYWEVTATGGALATNHGGIGIIERATLPNTGYIGGVPSGMSFGYGSSNPTYWLNWGSATLPSGQPPASSAITLGNVYMFALDMNSGQLWVGHNGTWYNSGNPGTGAKPAVQGLTGTVYPGVTFYAASLNAFTANFGQAGFTYTVPTGFTAGLYSLSSSADGAWRTDIRYNYGVGDNTQAYTHDYYLHSSLHEATKCPALGTTDKAIFDAADAYLKASNVGIGHTDPGAFAYGTDATNLANPFVSIQYNPLTSGYFTLFGKDKSTAANASYLSELWSLRRRFVASSDNRYILFRRVYGSRGAQLYGPKASQGNQYAYVDCGDAASFEVTTSNYATINVPQTVWWRSYTGYNCDAVVVNRAGAGVCVNIGGGGVITIGPDINNWYGKDFGYSTSDKFMWRHLMKEDRLRNDETSYHLFSPKRASAIGNGSAYEIYLPDYSVLRP